MNQSHGQIDFSITSFLDGFQQKFHVIFTMWTNDGQKHCEKKPCMDAMEIAVSIRAVSAQAVQ